MNTNVPFNKAKYLTSAVELGGCPTEIEAEVAFIGRSNAGKSSSINAITNQKSLAKTSKTPGRTQLINFFPMTNELALVDLPGYGYAKVTANMKKKWEEMITSYLIGREQLRGLIILMDIRHPLKENDIQMLQWAESYNIPIHIALTKSDKLKKGPANNAFFAVQREIVDIAPTATISLFSAVNKNGVDALKEKIADWLQSPDEL